MKMDSEELIKKICDEWHFALLGDLEQGVAWMNEKASDEFAKKYPNLINFGKWLNDLENEIG
jgi:hypothetical protein|tara:strand:+ start:2509 stop:2694 length:186 start_codon:yes stop_codon:yes gene_type:complete